MVVEALVAVAVGGATLAGATAAALLAFRGGRAWDRLLGDVAAHTGLQLRPATWLLHAKLRGTLRGFDVCVDRADSEETGQHVTRVRMRHPDLPQVRVDGAGLRIGRTLGLATGPLVGDPSFDAAVTTRGLPLDALLALLDPDGRAALVAFVQGGGVVRAGALVSARNGLPATSAELEAQIEVVSRAGAALLRGTDRDRLLDRAAIDPVPGVRRLALTVALRTGPCDPAWLRAMSADRDASVAVVAAIALEEHGRERLWQLARGGAERAAACLALAELPPDDRTPELEDLLLDRLAAEPSVPLAEALGRVGSVRSVLPLKDAAGPLPVSHAARAARDAVTAIQARAAGAPGGLALATTSGGELSGS